MECDMSNKYEKLKSLLMELFQLNQPDLDFGIYRIIHARSKEIAQFLDTDLLPQVKASFAAYQPADKVAIQKELDKVINAVKEADMDPEQSPKVKELRAKLANEAVDIGTLENEVYDHLFGFFRRYYSEGDFISKRVYKEGVYAIPYEGEEVKLHWANADQYYIKTSEYLRDYAFRLNPGNEADPKRVHFHLADAAEGEHGNVKEAEGKNRVFVLASENFISVENKELVIKFEYRPATLTDWPEDQRAGKSKPPAQKELIAIAEKCLLAVSDTALASWIAELGKKHTKADGELADYSKLVAHLNRYTARNTFDYFIHKDLGTFLNRELDFYIKSEVMHLDDVESETVPRVEQYLSKIKVIRKVAKKIIDFLAQLEDFQKKLWLKKKFVVETNYCITLDRVPEEFYAEIAANKAQVEEWVKLFAIDEILPTAGDLIDAVKPGYSVPLTVEFLKANDKLVLDTKFFSDEFKARLIGGIENFDEQMDGLLIHSENFQALNLLQARYREQVKCVYIDPPYNAKSSEILYKNNYKHSSWLSLINDRISISKILLKEKSNYVVAIDEVEQEKLGYILSDNFPLLEKSCIAINHNPSGQQGDNFSFTHEYAYFMHKVPGRSIAEQPRENPDEWDDRNFRDVTGEESLRTSAKTCFYPIFIKNNEIIGFGEVCEDSYHPKMNEHLDDGIIAVYPIDPQGVERKWRFGRSTVDSIKHELKAHFLSNRNIWDIKRLKKTFNYKSNWIDSKYSANNYGTQVLNRIIPNALASYPKSIHTTRDCIHAALNNDSNAIVLDYFAGSGTSAHSVIILNREDSGKRKYIMCEIGTHFDTVLHPRIQKVIYSQDWQDGKPTTRDTGITHCFKYIRLESYEDTLNNLDLRRTDAQTNLLDFKGEGADKFKEDYILRYMLDVESRGSSSLLNIEAFTDPTAYSLKVKIPGSDESREVKVDLLETFNYLLGLQIKNISAPHIIIAEFERDSEKRLRIKGRIAEKADGSWWFRTVTGTTLDGRKILVIWRKRPGLENPEGVEQDNLVLDTWFTKMGYSSKDSEFDTIYVNGTNNLENLKTPDDLWKVRLIEEDFARLMFEDAGV
jgi:adenine-specific DNA-methyltransferase